LAGSIIPRKPSLATDMAKMRQQLGNLATSPGLGNSTIRNGALVTTDANGKAQLLLGEYEWPYPPSTVIHGLVVFNGSGVPIIVLGEQPDGSTYGLGFYDATGNLTAISTSAAQAYTDGAGDNLLTISQDGMTLLTPAGEAAAFLGVLDTGNEIYGLEVAGPGGGLQQVGGAISNGGGDVTNVKASSWSSSSTAVRAVVGPSGQALITLNAELATAQGDNQQLMACVGVDGDTTDQYAYITLSSTAATNATVSGTTVATGLTAGQHTFRMFYYSANNGSSGPYGNIYNPNITVQPL